MISPADLEVFSSLRRDMVVSQLRGRGIRDERVLNAMLRVARHEFVPERYRDQSYEDHPLPIGSGQTISQPYIGAFMTEALQLSPSHRVLEVGTGSGYQAAVLAEIVKEVHTIEIVPGLADRSRKLLSELGYANVRVVTVNPGFTPVIAVVTSLASAATGPVFPRTLSTMKPFIGTG